MMKKILILNKSRLANLWNISASFWKIHMNYLKSHITRIEKIFGKKYPNLKILEIHFAQELI